MSAHQKPDVPTTGRDRRRRSRRSPTTPRRPTSSAARPRPIPRPTSPRCCKKAEAEAAELRDAWLRAARRHREHPQAGAAPTSPRPTSTRIERFAEELLPVKDTLESTLAAENASPRGAARGVELTLKQLDAAFDKAQIDGDRPGGPEVRSAPAPGDGDGRQRPSPPNTVVQVFQKGYLLNDRVLRPALVAVAKPKADDGAERRTLRPRRAA